MFPEPTDNSYVELIPKKPLSLTAFTLCMRLATELTGEREIILFAYRTPDYDELNVWREFNGTFSFYLSGEGVSFTLPQLGTFQTHLCAAWDSNSGLAAFYVDGKRSVRKIYKTGHSIRAEGRVILGQDPDSFLRDFDAKQSFVGEITDVNMWDYVLPDNVIDAFDCGQSVARGNVFDWETIEMKINGEVKEVADEL